MPSQLLDRTLLGDAEPGEAELTAIVRDALHRPGADIVDWRVERVPYEIGSPLTGGLFHVRGLARDGDWIGPWSVFVKLIRSWRHWPMLHIIPPDVREAMLQHPGWRNEPAIYQSDLASILPPGLRMPQVLHVRDLGDERFALWLEDVTAADGRWDLPRFERAARLLGQLTARMTAGDLLPSTVERSPGLMTRGFYASRLRGYAFPLLENDATWEHPAVAAAVDGNLRADLLELSNRLPAMLEKLDRLPQALIHGDACPQNLLVPHPGDEFVVVDWGMAVRHRSATNSPSFSSVSPTAASCPSVSCRASTMRSSRSTSTASRTKA